MYKNCTLSLYLVYYGSLCLFSIRHFGNICVFKAKPGESEEAALLSDTL